MSGVAPYSPEDVVELVELFTSFDLLGRMRRWAEREAFDQVLDHVAHSFLPETTVTSSAAASSSSSSSPSSPASSAAKGYITAAQVHERVVDIIRALVEQDIRLVLGPRHLSDMVRSDPEVQSTALAALALQDQQQQNYVEAAQQVVQEEQVRQKQLLRERAAVQHRAGFQLPNFEKLVRKMHGVGDEDEEEDEDKDEKNKKRRKKKRSNKNAASNEIILSAAKQAASISPLSALGGVILKYCERHPSTVRDWVREFQTSLVAARFDVKTLAERMVEALTGDVLDVLYPTAESFEAEQARRKWGTGIGQEEEEEDHQQQHQQEHDVDVFAQVLFDDSIYDEDEDEEDEDDAEGNGGGGAANRRGLSRTNLTVSGALQHIKRLLKRHNATHEVHAPGSVSAGISIAAASGGMSSRAAALRFSKARSPSPVAVSASRASAIDIACEREMEERHHRQQQQQQEQEHHQGGGGDAMAERAGSPSPDPDHHGGGGDAVFEAPPQSLVDVLSPLPPPLMRHRAPSPGGEAGDDEEASRAARRPVTRRQLQRALQLVPVLMSVVDVRGTGSVSLDQVSDFCAALIFARESASSHRNDPLPPWDLSGAGASSGTKLAAFGLRYIRFFAGSNNSNQKVLSFLSIPETSAADASAAATTTSSSSSASQKSSGASAKTSATSGTVSTTIPHRIIAPISDNKPHREFEDSALQKKLRVLLTPIIKEKAQRKLAAYTDSLVASRGQYPLTTATLSTRSSSSSSRLAHGAGGTSRRGDDQQQSITTTVVPRSRANKKDLQEIIDNSPDAAAAAAAAAGAHSSPHGSKLVGEPVLHEPFVALDIVLLEDIDVIAMSNSMGEVACFTNDSRATRLATSPRAVSAVPLLATCPSLYRSASQGGGQQRQIIAACDRSGRVNFFEMNRGGSQPSMCSMTLLHSETFPFPARQAWVHERNWMLVLLLSDSSVMLLDFRRVPLQKRTPSSGHQQHKQQLTSSLLHDNDDLLATSSPGGNAAHLAAPSPSSSSSVVTARIGSFPTRFLPSCAALSRSLSGLFLCGPVAGGAELVPLGCVSGAMKHSPESMVPSDTRYHAAAGAGSSSSASSSGSTSAAPAVKATRRGGMDALAAAAAAVAAAGDGDSREAAGAAKRGMSMMSCVCDPVLPQAITVDSTLSCSVWDLRNMSVTQCVSLAVLGDAFWRPKHLVISRSRNGRQIALLTDGSQAFWFERGELCAEEKPVLDFAGAGSDSEDIASDDGGVSPSRSNSKAPQLLDESPAASGDETVFETPVVAVFDFNADGSLLLVVTERSVVLWRHNPDKAEALKQGRRDAHARAVEEFEKMEQQRKWKESLLAHIGAGGSNSNKTDADEQRQQKKKSSSSPLAALRRQKQQQQQQSDSNFSEHLSDEDDDDDGGGKKKKRKRGLTVEVERDVDNACRRFDPTPAAKRPWEVFARGALPRGCAGVTAAVLNRVSSLSYTGDVTATGGTTSSSSSNAGGGGASSAYQHLYRTPHLVLGLADGSLLVVHALTAAVLNRVSNVFARPMPTAHESWNAIVPELMLAATDADASSMFASAAQQQQQQQQHQEGGKKKSSSEHNTNFAVSSLCLVGDSSCDVVACEKATGNIVLVRNYFISSSSTEASSFTSSWNARRVATHIIKVYGDAAPTCCAFTGGICGASLSVFSAEGSYFWPLKCWPSVKCHVSSDDASVDPNLIAYTHPAADTVVVSVLGNPLLGAFYQRRAERFRWMAEHHGALWHQQLLAAANTNSNEHQKNISSPVAALVLDDFLKQEHASSPSSSSSSSLLDGAEEPPPRRALVIMSRRVCLVALPPVSKRTRVAATVSDKETLLAWWSTALPWRVHDVPPTNVCSLLETVTMPEAKTTAVVLFLGRSDGTLTLYDVTSLFDRKSVGGEQQQQQTVGVQALLTMRPGSGAAVPDPALRPRAAASPKQPSSLAAADGEGTLPPSITLISRRRVTRRKLVSLVLCAAQQKLVVLDDAKTINEVLLSDLLSDELCPPGEDYSKTHNLAVPITVIAKPPPLPKAPPASSSHRTPARCRGGEGEQHDEDAEDEGTAAAGTRSSSKHRDQDDEQHQQQDEKKEHVPFAGFASSSSSSEHDDSDDLPPLHDDYDDEGAQDDDDQPQQQQSRLVSSPPPRPALVLSPSAQVQAARRGVAETPQPQQQSASLNRHPHRGPSFAQPRDSGRPPLRITAPKRSLTPQLMKSGFVLSSSPGEAAMTFLHDAETAAQIKSDQHSNNKTTGQQQHQQRPRTPMENVPTSELPIDVDKRFVTPSGPTPVKKQIVSDTLLSLYKRKPL